MAGIAADVLIRLMGESRDLDNATKKGSKGLDGMADSGDKADQSLGRLAARAASFAAGSVALGAITGWINEGTKLADTADLVRRSWDKTFGESSKQLTANITNTAHALGLADFEAQQMLVTTGQLAKSMGLSDEEAANMAEGLFTAAGDVAAFNGRLGESEEVLGAFTSALKGEFDALEGVGIKLNQADVNTRAMETTMKDATSELTKAELAAATYELVLEQLGDETGALEQAQKDGATSSNELAAEMTENQEKVGSSFQQVKTVAEQSLTSIIGFLESFGGWIARGIIKLREFRDKGVPFISQVADVLQGLVFWISGAKGGFQQFQQSVDRTKDAIKRLISSIGRIPKSIRNPFGNWRMPRLPSFATGGVVPGGAGTPQLVMAHGGEHIGSRSKAGGGSSGGGDTYVINVTGGLDSGQAIGQAIVDALQTYNRNTGPIAISTRNSDGVV